MSSLPSLTELRLRTRSRILEVAFDDGSRHSLSAEYLRVHSPSAEVQGHGPGQAQLVSGKQDVGITAVEPVGQYAVRLVFSDGHDTGLYTWKYLYELASQREARWNAYQARLVAAGKKEGRANGPAESPQDPQLAG
jgi:DUF971 family protein